ncbi:MAG: hypothetical protein H6694_00210 [Candidatus Latescibacteria bacterium]|nr:hypothetical protein [Candidatus Latescibacterota bacterium]
MRITSILLLLSAVIWGAVGCETPGTTEYANRAPEVYLSSGPANNAPNVNYKVHFYWNGYDPDGRVDHFEYLVTNDEVTGSLLIDENIYDTIAALDQSFPEVDYSWNSIEVHDTILSVSADSIPVQDVPEDSIYFYGSDRFLFRAHHTFFIRAVDEDGAHSTIPAHRTFTATTIAPTVEINHPANVGAPGGYDNMPQDIFFQWSGRDSVGNGTIIDPDSTRFALLQKGDYGIDTQSGGRLLDLPSSIWSKWRQWDEVDSLDTNLGGRRALVTGLTPSSAGEGQGLYLFLVQSKDEAGAITSHYQDGTNLRKIRVLASLQPTVTVEEPVLGQRVSRTNQTYDFTIAEDQPLNLKWSASAAEYGSEITGYRFGWDILDTTNDSEWSSWSLANTSSQTSFVSGTHVFYLEARDYSGTTTRVVFRLFVVPFTMERELLLIDDYSNVATEIGWGTSNNPLYWGTFAHNNAQQKAFWDHILTEYPAYDPIVDFFRVSTINNKPPFEVVASYKRLIWEVKEQGATESGLGRVARFVDAYRGGSVPFDYLSAFMGRGGEVLLCGSAPVVAMLPGTGDMGTEGYERKTPMAFLKHLGYSGGTASESVAAVQRFLPYRYFGLDAVVRGSDPAPRTFTWTGQDWTTTRTFWGLYGAGYPGNELDVYPNTVGWAPADTLRFRPEVYQWFTEAGPHYNDPEDFDCLDGSDPDPFGLANVEIYNWDYFRSKFDPPLNYRTNQYIPLLTYEPADSTTRWGSSPVHQHCWLTAAGEYFDELKYSQPAGKHKHAIAVVAQRNPEAPSVLLGFTPYYLAQDEAQGLVDHILIDMFGMVK